MKKLRYALPVFIAGLLLLVIAGVKLIGVITSKPTVLFPDTETSIHVTEPSELILWYYTESVVNGTYTQAEGIPDGLKIEAKFGEHALPINIDRGTTVTMGDGERKSMFSVPAVEPGDYFIRLRNAPPHYRFALTEGSGMKDFFIGFALGGFGGILVMAGVILLILALTHTFPKTKSVT